MNVRIGEGNRDERDQRISEVGTAFVDMISDNTPVGCPKNTARAFLLEKRDSRNAKSVSLTELRLLLDNKRHKMKLNIARGIIKVHYS